MFQVQIYLLKPADFTANKIKHCNTNNVQMYVPLQLNRTYFILYMQTRFHNLFVIVNSWERESR